MGYAARADADPIAAVDRLRGFGWTVVAACAAIGITRTAYYRRRDRSRQGRNAGAIRHRHASAQLHAPRVHWTAQTPVQDWFSLAPPWSANGAAGFSPFAILKAAPKIDDPRRRKLQTISERLAPVVDRTDAYLPSSRSNPAPHAPLRLRSSLGARRRGLLAPMTSGLGGALTWAAHAISQAAAPALVAAAFAMFGAIALATAANPSAMHLSRAPDIAAAPMAIADIE